MSDLEIDIPGIFRNLAVVLAELVKVQIVDLQNLRAMCEKTEWWGGNKAPAVKLFEGITARLKAIAATSDQIGLAQTITVQLGSM